MADVKWTDDQRKAIDTRYKNILVSAAAGSGKTAVLVERIINIITDADNPVDIDKLMIVTFTNAAAAEMRERIGEAISRRIKEDPSSRNLQRQLVLLNKASISTLHSFCLNVIKNNFHQIDIEPSFRIGDTTEINLMKTEAIEELLEDKYVEGKTEFLQLVESYCDNKTDKALSDIILKLYGFSMSMADPEEWLLKSAEAFNVSDGFSFDSLPFKDVLLKELKEDIFRAMELNNKGMDFVLERPYLEKYKKNFEEDGEILQKTLDVIESGFKKNLDYIGSASFGRIATISKLNDEEKAEQNKAKAVRDEVKDIFTDVKGRISNATSEDISKNTANLYPLMKELASLVIEFKERFDNKKRERNIIDFNDQEHFALQILRDKDDSTKPSNVALELRKKYEEILVDEYQDSNNVQEEIITLISRKEKGQRNMFMVGDLKQSIYRFRMAKPELFKEKKETYPKCGDDYNELITLHKNFRSREEVIDGINYIFKSVMSEDVGELTYDEGEELKAGASYKEYDGAGNVGGAVELDIIDFFNDGASADVSDEKAAPKEAEEASDTSSDTDGSGDEDELSAEELTEIQAEARFTAERIERLVNSDGEDSLMVYDKHIDGYRKASYKDIVILLRSSNKLSPIYEEEFKKAGIPLFTEGSGGYFDTLEVKTVLSVLEIIDNPIQDIPLIAAMRSPFGGFTTEELTDIRLTNKSVSFYAAMIGLINGDKSDIKDELILKIYEDEKLKKKIRGFIDRIDSWRDESRYMPINKLIWKIITDTGYYGYAGALPGGRQRQANLKILFKRAKEFEKTSYKGLYSFINFIHNIKLGGDDLGSAKVIGENEDVVRIMSIHKSKGLEFPIVFLCAVNKNFNTQDLKGKILFHEQLGFGPAYIDLDNRISYNTVQREFISKKIKSENISEEMRLLYVALTRAKEKLILVGSAKNLKKDIDKWAGAEITGEGTVASSYTKNQKSYMGWIGASVINHRDGEELRHFDGDNIVKSVQEDERSSFKVNIYKSGEFAKEPEILEEESKVSERLNELQEADGKAAELVEIVDEKLNYSYKYEKATVIPTVVTVTKLKESSLQNDSDRETAEVEELKESRHKFIQLKKTPMFLQEKKGLTPAEIGTTYHAVMQRLVLSEGLTTEDVQKQIDSMVDNELLTLEAAKTVKAEKIAKFYQQDVGRDVICAFEEGRLRRELPFRININPASVYSDMDSELYRDDTMMLRGVIDCFIDCGEDGVIIDYKTDYVKEGDEQLIVDRYKVQLDYYSDAVKKLLNKKHVKKYLYLFSLDKFVEVE